MRPTLQDVAGEEVKFMGTPGKSYIGVGSELAALRIFQHMRGWRCRVFPCGGRSQNYFIMVWGTSLGFVIDLIKHWAKK